MWPVLRKEKKTEEWGLADRMAGGFWYWSSILEGAMALYREEEEPELPTPQIRQAVGELLAEAAGCGARAAAGTTGEELIPYLEWAFEPWEKEFLGDWRERTGGRFRFQYRGDRRKLVSDLWDYLRESDSFYLFLTECISNEEESRAIGQLRAYLEENGEATEEALCLGQLLLVLGALFCASGIDFLKRRLDGESDFARMLRNTLREYRSVDQVAERTYEIYRTHFAEETEEELSANAYKVLLAKFVLDGEDHIYQVYEEFVRADREKVWNEAEDAGEYREWIIRTAAENYAAYDFAHPLAFRFYTRAMERPLAEVLPFSDTLLMFEQARDWEEELREQVHQAKLEAEKSRYVAGDFAAEHLFLQGDAAFSHIHSGTEFEQYLKHIFTRLGYESDLTKGSGDQGADLILKKNGLSFVVQAKYYEKPVGNKAVQEAAAALKFYGANRAVVVTNSRYTKGAEALAKRNQVILLDGAALEELVRLAYSERALGHMF